MAAVSVVEDADGVARLRIDNRQQEGSSATLRVDGRQALLPVLLHPAPRRALFLGLGTGVTASSAAEDPALAGRCSRAVAGGDRGVRALHARDLGRRAESAPSPDGGGRAPLRARERPTLRRHRLGQLSPGAQRLGLALHRGTFRGRARPARAGRRLLPVAAAASARSGDAAQHRAVVPVASIRDGWAMLASNSLETPVLGLVGRADDGRFDVGALRARHLAERGAAGSLADLGIEDEFALLGSFVAGPEALQRFAGNAPPTRTIVRSSRIVRRASRTRRIRCRATG